MLPNILRNQYRVDRSVCIFIILHNGVNEITMIETFQILKSCIFAFNLVARLNRCNLATPVEGTPYYFCKLSLYSMERHRHSSKGLKGNSILRLSFFLLLFLWLFSLLLLSLLSEAWRHNYLIEYTYKLEVLCDVSSVCY